ncbi:MAG: sensor histidine kinase [Actinomycetota bacterium]
MPRAGALLRSFAAKLAASAVLFLLVPLFVYGRLDAADRQRGALMLTLVQEQGRLAAEALFPLLDQFSPRAADRLAQAVIRLADERTSIWVLFRPAAAKGPEAFLLIAEAPPVPREMLRQEQARLVGSGALASLATSCQGNTPLALQLADELLTHAAPHLTPAGCWVVLTARGKGELPDRPYWQAPELRIAAAIYLLLAVLVLSLFADSWRDLGRFRAIARRIRTTGGPASFATENRVPELAEVAAEFDAMVASLGRTETLLRQMAEENAHALKAPLAVISQALPPLEQAVPPGATRAVRAVELVRQSVDRLDALVSATRRMDEAVAALVEAPRRPLALAPLLAALAEGYRPQAEASGLRLVAQLSAVTAFANEDMVETVVENLLDNALDFAPAGTEVTLALAPPATIVVSDQGPGVPDDRLDTIFGRHVSTRADGPHYGLGLWLVRRNAEAMGGRAWARNRPEGGLAVTVELAAAD